MRLEPVLIDEQGCIYSPDDPLPSGERAVEWVEQTMKNDPLAEPFISLSQKEELSDE